MLEDFSPPANNMLNTFQWKQHPGLSLRAGGWGFSPCFFRYIPDYFDIKPACWLHFSNSNFQLCFGISPPTSKISDSPEHHSPLLDSPGNNYTLLTKQLERTLGTRLPLVTGWNPESYPNSLMKHTFIIDCWKPFDIVTQPPPFSGQGE